MPSIEEGTCIDLSACTLPSVTGDPIGLCSVANQSLCVIHLCIYSRIHVCIRHKDNTSSYDCVQLCNLYWWSTGRSRLMLVYRDCKSWATFRMSLIADREDEEEHMGALMTFDEIRCLCITVSMQNHVRLVSSLRKTVYIVLYICSVKCMCYRFYGDCRASPTW